jgi:hypothetical protein
VEAQNEPQGTKAGWWTRARPTRDCLPTFGALRLRYEKNRFVLSRFAYCQCLMGKGGSVNTSDDLHWQYSEACVKLICKALEPPPKFHGLSLDFIRPRISKASLRGVGITASDPVLHMMVWWPRVRLSTILTRRRLTNQSRAAILDSVGEEVEVLVRVLAEVYWAARECNEPADLVEVDRSIRSQQDPWYRTTDGGVWVSRSQPTLGTELDISESRIMTIDLNGYEGLETYPSGLDWSVERQRILFLRTAIRLGFDWIDILELTNPYFGHTLNQPPVPVVYPYRVPPFGLPDYDVARQTPDEWAAIADYQWQRHRNGILSQIIVWRSELIRQGKLAESPRHRKHSGIDSQKKAHIVDEQEAFEWAAIYFFGPRDESKAFADLARLFADRRVRDIKVSNQRKTRQRATQIRKRVSLILGELGLPMRK